MVTCRAATVGLVGPSPVHFWRGPGSQHGTPPPRAAARATRPRGLRDDDRQLLAAATGSRAVPAARRSRRPLIPGPRDGPCARACRPGGGRGVRLPGLLTARAPRPPGGRPGPGGHRARRGRSRAPGRRAAPDAPCRRRPQVSTGDRSGHAPLGDNGAAGHRRASRAPRPQSPGVVPRCRGSASTRGPQALDVGPPGAG